ncbi:CBS domain-containing protein [Sorangium sp. So ce281]|uniref:CBS domain-containing protein n=1 Tax=unclassified Sorangium TaxID=2621164 RepID=UPI003F5EB127
MSLIEFCRRDVVTVRPEASVGVAAELLVDQGVGALVVVADGTRPVGVVTDRDLVLRVMAAERDPERTTVADVMSQPAITAGPLDRLEATTARMRELGVRRMPVVSPDGELIGLLSADDLIDLFGRELHDLGEAVRKEVMASQQRS